MRCLCVCLQIVNDLLGTYGLFSWIMNTLRQTNFDELRCWNTFQWKENTTRLGCFYVTAILSWGWVEFEIETEVDLRLRLKWGWDWGSGWDEIELKPSRGLVELIWGWIKGKIRVRDVVQNPFFRSTHISDEHLFSMFPSILTLDFDLIYRLFLACWGPNGLYFCSSKTCQSMSLWCNKFNLTHH